MLLFQNRIPVLLVALLATMAAAIVFPPRATAQETPYFVTYSHHLEEPGNLEIEFNPIFGTQRGGNGHLAGTTEFEYGVKAWWTSKFYLDGQSTFGDSTLFNGFRWENRFRLLMREHWINPVLYLDYENASGADKAMIEVVAFDQEANYAAPNSVLRKGLGSRARRTDLGPRSLRIGIRCRGIGCIAWACNFCAENLLVGAEFYGGLGTTWNATTSGTSHYGAAILGWQLPNGATFRLPRLGVEQQ